MTILYILLAIIVLLLLITVHEFGHYCAGKIFGFKINEFSIGFGPAIYKRTKKDGEIFAIRALPLGGFCAFEGEDEAGNEHPQSFNKQPAWKRLIVLLSGVTFNFLFGILTAAIYLMVSGYNTSKITYTINQNNAQTMGFKANDIVIAVDGKRVEAYRSFDNMIAKMDAGEEFVVTVERDGKIIDITTKKQSFAPYYFAYYEGELKNKLYTFDGTNYVQITDSALSELGQSLVNTDTSAEVEKGKGEALKPLLANYFYKVSDTEYKPANDDAVISLLLNGDEAQKIAQAIIYAVPNAQSVGVICTLENRDYGFFESFAKAWPYCFYMCGLILSVLGGLFTGKTALKEMGGTITAVSQIAEISQMGFNYFLLLLPLLSMNLALFNVLPIPSLDGARSIFVLYEVVFRKPFNRKIEAYIHTIGLFLLLGMVIFFDIYHFAVAARLLI